MNAKRHSTLYVFINFHISQSDPSVSEKKKLYKKKIKGFLINIIL